MWRFCLFFCHPCDDYVSIYVPARPCTDGVISVDRVNLPCFVGLKAFWQLRSLMFLFFLERWGCRWASPIDDICCPFRAFSVGRGRGRWGCRWASPIVDILRPFRAFGGGDVAGAVAGAVDGLHPSLIYCALSGLLGG